MHLGEPSFALCAAGVVAVTLLAWLLRKRLPGLGAAWLAYLIILAPNSGLIRFSPQLAADRYSYAASLPWVVVLAGGLVSALASRRTTRIISAAGMAVLALGFCTMSWYQCATWRHSVALWDHALEVGSDRSLEAHGNLALALSMVGLESEALQQYEAAVRVAPHSTKACMYLAESLARQGRNDEAIGRMRQAVQNSPESAVMHYYLGSFLMRFGKNEEAEASLRQSLRLDPDNSHAHRDLGVLLALREFDDEARQHFLKALEIQPDDSVAQSNLQQLRVDQAEKRTRAKPPHPAPSPRPARRRSAQARAANPTSVAPAPLERGFDEALSHSPLSGQARIDSVPFSGPMRTIDNQEITHESWSVPPCTFSLLTTNRRSGKHSLSRWKPWATPRRRSPTRLGSDLEAPAGFLRSLARRPEVGNGVGH